jgi:hypothetical protein
MPNARVITRAKRMFEVCRQPNRFGETNPSFPLLTYLQ